MTGAQAYKQQLIKDAGDDADAKKKAEETEVDPTTGPWRITLDGPSYIAAMQHLPNRELRKEVYMGYLTRASDLSNEPECDAEEKKEGALGKNNVEIINEILKLRKEMSGLLGFKNYAGELLLLRLLSDLDAVIDSCILLWNKCRNVTCLQNGTLCRECTRIVQPYP